jgi:hypothetical protein
MIQTAKINALQPVHACLLAALAVGAAGCASSARLPVSAGTGPSPTLPPPQRSLIPLVHVVKARGWPDGASPAAAEGTAVKALSP